MKFKVVEDAIRECRKHLDDTGLRGSETENRLAAFLLVLISAQYEVRIKAILSAYVNRLSDKRVRGFITK